MVVRGKGPSSLLALLLLWTAPSAAAEPGGPEQIRFQLERSVARAGERLTVTILLRDEEGHPRDADVALVCDFCTVGAVERIAEGSYRVALTAPETIPSTRSLLLFAQAGRTSGDLELPVIPGPAAALEVSGPRAVLADGSFVELRVTLTDAYGNPAEAVPLARASNGELREPRRVALGIWNLGYRPRKVLARAREEIAIEAGAARGSFTLRLDPRQSWLGGSAWTGVAASGGASSLAFGANLSWWWRDEVDQLGVLVDAGWWSREERATVALPGAAAELTSETSTAPVTVSFSWGHEFGRHVAGWIAAGGGAARVSSSQQLTGQARITEARWAPAASASVSLGARALRGLAYVELRGLWTGDPGLATATGDSRALLVLGGYRYDAR